MANLLSWSGLSPLKKKNNTLLGGTSIISSLRNPIQITQSVNNESQTSRPTFQTSNSNSTNNTSNTSKTFTTISNIFQQQNLQAQQAEQQRQQEEQRRQQEEEQRRQRIEQERQEQEKRQQEEQARKLQQQQEQQQKQQQLLSSSLSSNGLNNDALANNAIQQSKSKLDSLSTLGTTHNLFSPNRNKTESDINYDNWLKTTSMEDLSKEMEKAAKNADIDWIRRIEQYSGKSARDFDLYKKQVDMQNSELNLGRSASTNLRDVNDTKTYDELDTSDSDNLRYFSNQNLLRKSFKPALGDDANVSDMSYQDIINAYNNASGDQQADIKKAIADEIVNQREYAKGGNKESLKSASYLADLNALLNEYGLDKGKSFGKQVGDWLTTGGFVGNIGGNQLTEALGNLTGNEDSVKAYLEKQQNKRTDLGVVGAADSALTGIANTALNLGTGGWYGIANAGVGLGNTIAGLDDKVLDFNDYGQASIRDKEQGERMSELGGAALNAGFALAGKAGMGPGLGRGTLKDIAQYAWQEPIWAGGTTLVQEGLSNLGKGKDFTDYDWGRVGKSFVANLGQDIGMDLFNLGQGRARTRVETQAANKALQKDIQDGNIRQLEDGTIVRINADGTASRLSDSELSKIATENTDSRKTVAQTSGAVDNNMDGVINGKPRKKMGEIVDDAYTKVSNIGADKRLKKAIISASNEDTPYKRMTRERYEAENMLRTAQGKEPLKNRRTSAGADVLSSGHYLKHTDGYATLDDQIAAASDAITGKNGKSIPAGRKNSMLVDSNVEKPTAVVLDENSSIRSISRRDKNRIKRGLNEANTILGGLDDGRSSSSSGVSSSAGRPISSPQADTDIVTQKGKKVQSGVAKLADMSYDVSTEMKGKAKKAAKKAAEVANEHPLGGTTKLMNLSNLEGDTGATDNGDNAPVQKMTTEQFFEAKKLKSNDLSAMKQNYPNEVKSVKKLISAGVTPETFNSKVLNSDGTVKKAYQSQDIPAMRGIFELSYDYNQMTDAGSMKDQRKANIFNEDVIKENTTAKSGLAKNTIYNQAFSAETRNALASDPVEYKPTTNEERLARANEILSSKSIDEIDSYLRDNYFNTADKNRNSGDTVLAGEFAKMLDAEGQYGRATEIVQKMSEIATKQGQQIQALSIMANRTPEGIANMAQTAIQKGGGKVDGELRKWILSDTRDIGVIRSEKARLTAENDDVSYKIMNGVGDLPTLRKRQMEIAQEYRTCLDQEGRAFAHLSETVSKHSPRDKSIFGSVWRAGLLSGPRTHVGNAVSNTFQNVLNAGADRIASGIDWARSKITGSDRQVVSSAGGRGQGLKRGLKAAGEVLKTGTNLWEGTEKVTSNQPNAWGYGGELEFKNKIADTMVAKPTNYVFRAMSAGDLPFRYSAFENAIRTEAKRQGMNQGYKGQALQDYINSRVATPDPDLQAYGIKKGNESVYDADTFLSRTMASLDKQINKIDNKVGRTAARTAKTLIAPFVKVPSKVLSTAVDYSPIGAVQAIVKKVGGSKNYSVGQFETDIAKSSLGTGAFVGLGYALSSAGLLTGSYPDDNDERNRWKAQGIEPNSIKIGDKYVSLNYLGPAAILMGVGAGVQQRQEKGQDPFTVTVGTIGDAFNSFFEQSYVQGLNSAINAVKDSQRYGESYANSLARGMVPNLSRQIAVATDSKQRQVDNPLEAIISGIPGLSQTLDAKVDVYGQEIENKQTLPLGQMWDALKISNSRETNAVIDEVSRLHDVDPSNKDLQVTPPTQSGTISVDGVSVKLTDDQKTQLQKDTGAAALKAMQQVIDSEKYQSLTDLEKAAALDKARSEAQKQARKQFIEANNITPESNSGTRNAGGDVSGDYASKAITSATSNTEGKSAITPNSSIGQSSKDILDKYNSMSKEDWEKYLYGSTAECAAAEYNLAKAKYENDIANDKLTEAQKVKREKELRKLNVSKDWEKKYRDAYSLAGSKSDMQEYLNSLDDAERAETVGILNGLNRAMYEAGVIQASTFKTRYNAINNTSSSSSSGSKSKGASGISSAEASALAGLAKTMVKNTNTTKASTTKAPETKRKMNKGGSGSGNSGLATYTPSGAKKITVTKGAKTSIV